MIDLAATHDSCIALSVAEGLHSEVRSVHA